MSAGKVVIADDEPHIRHVLALKLTKGGLEVLTAEDGGEALDLCRGESPDLLITDYQMPVLSGAELCRKLRESPDTRDLPVIMLTARGFDLAPLQTEDLGITLLMSKPFSPAEMLDKVRETLDCRRLSVRES